VTRAPTSTVFGAAAADPAEQLAMPKVEAEAMSAAAALGHPAFSDELRDLLVARAAAEIEAASAAALGALAFTDARVQAEMEARAGALASARQLRDERAHAHDAAGRALSLAPAPMSVFGWLAIAFVAALGGAIAAVVIGALMGPSVHEFLLSGYLTDTLGLDAPRFGALIGFEIAAGASGLSLFVQVFAMLAKRGRMSLGLKLGFVLSDLLVAAAFAVMRLELEFSWQAVAVSGFEFALSFAVSLLVFGLGTRLARNADRADSWRVARRAVAHAGRSLNAAEREVFHEEIRRTTWMLALERREDAARRAGCHKDVAQRTAAVGYALGVSKILDTASRNATDDAVSGWLDAHLAASFRVGQDGRR
jgi:hypothetical protein